MNPYIPSPSLSNDLSFVCHISLILSLFWSNLFIYLWLCWVFVAALRLSLVAEGRDSPLWWCTGFSLWGLLLLRSTGSRCAGLGSCDSGAQLYCGMWDLSSWTRDQICVPCRWILNHWTTKGSPLILTSDFQVLILLFPSFVENVLVLTHPVKN